MQNNCLIKPDFSYFSNYKRKKYIVFGQNMIISSHLLITNQLNLDFGLLKAWNVDIVEKAAERKPP